RRQRPFSTCARSLARCARQAGTGVLPSRHDRVDCALPCRLGSIVMEVLSSRFLLRPRDLERSLRFYEETLGLAVYREWGSGQERGVVFFLGGGLLEVAGSTGGIPSEAVRLFFQVRELRAVRSQLAEKAVVVEEEPELKPWGLLE